MTTLPKKVLAAMLATSVTLSIQFKPVQGNPAILAPTLCATGVGCVLVGTVAIGGGLYYVWEFQGGKQLAADAAGNVLRMLVDPEDPEGSMAIPENGAFYAPDRPSANKQCRERGFRGAVRKRDMSGGYYYVCEK